MKLKCFHVFKPKLPKPKFTSVHCFSLKRPRLKRRRFRPKFKKLRLPKIHRPKKLKFKTPKRKRSRLNPVPDPDRFIEKVSELVSVLDRVLEDEKTEHSVLLTDTQTDAGFAVAVSENVTVCRRFESYVAEMIVEEGKMKDLMDVEEMLYCWRSLKSPVFVDLVSRFYGEMCLDLFSVDEDEDGKITNDSLTSIATTATTATTETSE